MGSNNTATDHETPHRAGAKTDRAVLVTGGAGFIGAHVLKHLSEAGWRPVAFDDLSNGHRDACAWGDLVVGDIRDSRALSVAMDRHGVEAVIHLAGLIDVARSTESPDLFWDCNVRGTASLIQAMRSSGVRRLVFSSSAAVYGVSATAREDGLLSETDPVSPVSPYGDTKLAAERMIAAACADVGLTAFALRYFNAAGADPSGSLGEAHDPETHLIPLAIQAALGQRAALTIFGSDFDTPDGTCLRDYVHVSDLARAHVAALEASATLGEFHALNIGTGRGHSVREVIEAVELALLRPVPRSFGARRPGDPPSLVADPSRAAARLGWRATASSLAEIVGSAARWHANPAYGPINGSGRAAVNQT